MINKELSKEISKVIIEMSEKMLGAVVVINKENNIEGIITDGDLRRQLIKSLEIFQKLNYDKEFRF